MTNHLETGKTIRRQVRNKHQKLVAKIFHIKEVIAEGDDWIVMHVVDQDTMSHCTLKIIEKNDNMPKERKDQIFN